MREIKFRAWDKRQIEIYGTGMSYGSPEYFDDMLAFRFNHFESDNPSEIIYEQYTGMKDMNGKEIYEGDILRVGTFSEEVDGEESWWMDDSVHRVEWCGAEDYPAFDLRPSIDTDCNGLSYIAVGEQQAEVIGNIHENPELIP